MADNRVVKTSYMDENEDGKEGNIWDHLVHRKDVTGTKKDPSEETEEAHDNSESTKSHSSSTTKARE